MSNRMYASIPISKAKQYIKVDYQFCRLSLDKGFIIWDQVWDARVLDKMKKDPDVKVMTHGQALKEMDKVAWFDKSTIEGLKSKSS